MLTISLSWAFYVSLMEKKVLFSSLAGGKLHKKIGTGLNP
jgi:hypothetical protein